MPLSIRAQRGRARSALFCRVSVKIFPKMVSIKIFSSKYFPKFLKSGIFHFLEVFSVPYISQNSNFHMNVPIIKC